MDRHLCIHGHFYQPPREDPWLRTTLPEGSAAPGLNWNERIGRESYAPLAWARVLGEAGRIRDIVNVYEYLSFNFGPTLFTWMERNDPDTYARIIEADAQARRRIGFGGALAQICHHVIMPLASNDDKKIETAWAVQDFEARFGRHPDGLWLSETAVDTPTLEVLAQAGIAFTVLAPRQAAAVAPLGADQWRDVDEGSLDISRPYRVELPSGRSISVFFYHGGLSQAVAFEQLLRDGDAFWTRIRGASMPGLLSLATDGETYGHHFTFGEMALAFMLMKAEADPEITLTNYSAHLAAHPPIERVRLREPSSWSCVHGVERWRADCGCHTGGHPRWNQKWRAPLRRAQDGLRSHIHAHFMHAGPDVFTDAFSTLSAYGSVRYGKTVPQDFAAEHFRPGLDATGQRRAWDLLEMEQWSLASLASCAWFFDDLDRIEPLNAMTYALRALELARATGLADDPEPAYLNELGQAIANGPPPLSGAELYAKRVLPRMESAESLVAQALITLWVRGQSGLSTDSVVHWPGVRVEIVFDEAPGAKQAAGRAIITRPGDRTDEHRWLWERSSTENPLECTIMLLGPDGQPGRGFTPAMLPWNKRQALSLEWVKATEDTQWQRQEIAAGAGLHFMQPWTESQATQNMAWAWGRLWAPLAWAHVMAGDRSPRNVREFLLAHAPGESDRRAFERRIVGEALRLLGDTPNCPKVLDILRRAADVCPGLDMWRVQNRVWCLDIRHEGQWELSQFLGFAPDVRA
ncbi:hypothetical protein GGQ74_002699 [Desulfobaculum xiamenense]|uniref:Glycoside hydrolase family 57 N-terminal domain-containing protein n=1 Tax=Desulfobaculum xiamenense TaxID=995050 RepID=A0A846QU43_9BACT|nr:DUF3536 domain-containing protein [Desulfobaculum xiamenense]NJB69005.1 hypothetical protein [Desulfobaculum xiamenense]